MFSDKEKQVLEELQKESFKLHDGEGFIEVIDAWGGDGVVIDAARLTAQSMGLKVSKASDRGLLRYLVRHRHTTPLEFAGLTIKVRVPMDTWRQWIRHRTASCNEYSTRYSEAIDVKATTAPCDWRIQADSNRQGSSGQFFDVEEGTTLTEAERNLHEHGEQVYQDRIDLGVAREQARKDLPLSTMTEAYWSIDLHNLLHFLSLRMEPKAQLEIRLYANIIGNEIVSKLFPLAWEAFQDYKLNAIILTAQDQAVIQQLLAGGGSFDNVVGSIIKNKRETDECRDKLEAMGFGEYIHA